VNGTGDKAREQLGSLTKLPVTLKAESPLADTLPAEFEMSETQDRQEDSTDAGSLRGATLPQLVAQERARLEQEHHQELERQKTLEKRALPLDRIITVLVTLAIVIAGTAAYLFITGE
jgi:hypothetical protein